MAINYPIIYEIAYQTYDINEFGMASFFVLVGENRGLVIDCGCGSFDARGLVEKLCPLPYDVVITHAHGDHCGAMSQWDKVWLHPREFDFAHNTEHLVDMLHQNPALWRGAMERGIHIPMADGSEWNYPSSNMGAKEFYELDDLKFMGFKRMPQFLPLTDGQIFDLGGGRVVETVYVPGHGAGHCAFIDPSVRILFSGDCCNYNLGLGRTSVNTALKGLLNLASHRHKFDRNFNGHTAPGADTAGFSMPPTTLDDCIAACRSIINGTAEVTESSAENFKRAVVHYGAVQVGFNPQRIIDEGEEPVDIL